MIGRFISLEGGEGVGKSTQVARLAAALASRGVNPLVTREPGGSAGAEAIRALLLGGDADRWSARAEALLFAAARTDHVDRTIRPALAEGRWVICDRFVDSSRAYQGGLGGVSDADLLALHRIGSDGFLPDRTLVLTLDGAEALTRAGQRDEGAADRIGGRGDAFHAGVAARFHRIAEAEPARVRLVAAHGAPAEVTRRLVDALVDLLP